MIAVTNYRSDDNERASHGPYGEMQGRCSRTVADALCNVVQFELGYGGRVKELDENRIVIQTKVMSKIDHTILEGSKEDMLEIHRFLYFYHSANSEQDCDELFKQVEGTELGRMLHRPLYLTTVAPLLLGGGRAHRAAALYLSEVESDVELFMGVDLETLLTLVKSKIDDDVVIDELRARVA